MGIAVAAVVALLVGVGVLLGAPGSPTKAKYQRIVAEKTRQVQALPEVFTQGDLQKLPEPLQRYFHHCGYLGTPKMAYMRAWLTGVEFMMSPAKTLCIDYQQINLAQKPERFALISASLAGIPFEGLDCFEEGQGGMKGMLGKVIPLFDQRGEEMDRACLVTWLAECPLMPSAALQDFVRWESLNELQAKAAITWNGISAGGAFTFSPEGELLSFRTGDRTAIDMQGNKTQADWSAYYRDYRRVNGILQPRVIQSVWHEEAGDRVYFNQNEAAVKIRYDGEQAEEV